MMTSTTLTTIIIPKAASMTTTAKSNHHRGRGNAFGHRRRSRRFFEQHDIDATRKRRRRQRGLVSCKSSSANNKGRRRDDDSTTTSRSFFDDDFDDDFFRKEIGFERLMDRSFHHRFGGRVFDQEEAEARNNNNNNNNNNNKNTTNAYEAFGPNKTIAKEIRKEHRGRHSYSNFHYTESVTTYGGAAAAPLSRARSGGVVLDAPTTLGCVVLLGMTYAYFKEKMVFSRNFSRTNFKEEEKEKLAREWPLLYASSETFRREFRKTKEEETTTTTTKTGSDAITNTNSESVNAGRDDTTPDASTAR
tara:strand:+ start:5951 stop:6862 length:912 start_codon:yes stop_codon:yes gene_type:complete